MNKDKESKGKESTLRNEEDDKSYGQLKSLNQSEGPDSWGTAEFPVDRLTRRRPSSWDNSDDESPSTTINSLNDDGLIYSGDFRKQEKYIAAGKNDIETQYFKNFDTMDDLSKPRNSNFETNTCKNVEGKEETKGKLEQNDRRKSPARIRRRTKSSSSSSAVLEPMVEYNSPEYNENSQILTPESYQHKVSRYQSYSSENSSLRSGLELDSNYFFDHIFTELRTNIAGLISLGEESSFESREGKMLNLESYSGSNIEFLKSHDLAKTFSSSTYNSDLKTLKSFECEEPIAFVHKTSRKLSQILEVEETKKSQEVINILEEEGGVQLIEISPFLWANSPKLPDNESLPFPTSNNRDDNALCWTSIISLREKTESPTLETVQLSSRNIGSLEKLKEKGKPENDTKGQLSESYPYRDSNNITFLTEKKAKTQLDLNSEKQEDSNCSLLKDYEKFKYIDEIDSCEILEMENYNSESERIDIGGKNSGRTIDSGSRQKNLKHVKTPKSEIEKNSHEERIPNLLDETIISWSAGSTPRSGSSRHSLKRFSNHERDPDFRLEMESSNTQFQRLTSRSLKIERTPNHSSRESSFLLNDRSIKSRSGETCKGSSQKTSDNLHPKRMEDQANFLNIDLEKVCSSGSSSTESNSISSRTSTHKEIKDLSFQTDDSDQSAISSHTSEPPKNRCSKKMKNYLSDNSHHNSRSCSSGVSDDTGLNDAIENLENTIIPRQRENYTFYDDVTVTTGNVISEKINSNRSTITGTKCKNDKSFVRNEGVRKGLCERSEESVGGEDFKRNLFSVQIKDAIQVDFKSCKKIGGTVRSIVPTEKFSADILPVEESENYLDGKRPLCRSSTESIDKEPTIPKEKMSYNLEKIEINSDQSDREKEIGKTEVNQESDRSRRTGRLLNEPWSITCEKFEENTVKLNISSEETNNRICACTKTEGCQMVNEKLKNASKKKSFQKSLAHETSNESMALKSTFQDNFNKETWNKLIDAFEGSKKSNHSSENKFPGFPFPNQKEFTEHNREETQDFFLYELHELNESDDFITLSRRLIETESSLWSPKERKLKGSINLPLEHSEGRIISRSDKEKIIQKHDSKRRNFEIGESGDGNCLHDGEPDISETEKPQHHGDGNQERRNNRETLVLRLEDNKEEKQVKSGRHTRIELEKKAPRPNLPKNKSFSGKGNKTDLEPKLISHNLNHSKSENNLSKMWRQQKTKQSEIFKTSTYTDPMKGITKGKSNKNSVPNSKTGNCSEESFYLKRDLGVGRSYSSDESLIYEKNSRKKFEGLNTVTTEMENRKQEKELTNLNIFLLGRKKEKALVKPNNWLIIKNQEGKQSKQQKEKIQNLKKKLKKCERLNSSKKPSYIDESVAGKMPDFVPALKFGDVGCLQNFYKRIFTICCLTSNSSAGTSV